MSTIIRGSVVRAPLLAAALLLAGGSQAAPAELEQRLHEEVQMLLLRLVESGEVAAGELGSLTVAAEPTRRADFGAIVDLRADPAQPGVAVMAVTPGGNAAALGLRAGDRILAVDGERLQAGGEAGTSAATQLQRRLAEGDGQVSLTVLRDAHTHHLRGPVRAWTLPAYRLELGSALAGSSMAATRAEGGCGRISMVGMPPRTDNIFPATLIFIDGHTPKPYGGPAYRLSAGRHVLTVDERIDASRIGMKELRDRQRRQLDREGYKTLELVVQPGTTYRLGARFIPERSHRVLENAYWEPVIYAEAHEPCG